VKSCSHSCTPSPGAGRGRPTVVWPKSKLSGSTGEISDFTVQIGEPTCDLHEVLDVKEHSEEHSLRSGSEHPSATRPAHADTVPTRSRRSRSSRITLHPMPMARGPHPTETGNGFPVHPCKPDLRTGDGRYTDLNGGNLISHTRKVDPTTRGARHLRSGARSGSGVGASWHENYVLGALAAIEAR
jgi:hypothetical protein